MRRRRSHGLRLAGATVAVVVALSGTAVAGASRAGDQQIADDAALTIDDVPAGFQSVKAQDAPELQPGAVCTAIRAAAKAADAVPHTEVEFRTPSSDTGGALINNQVSVTKSVKKAKAVYAPYAAPAAKRCLTSAYERAFLQQLQDPSANVKVGARRYSPGLGDASVGYRVEIDASAKGDSQKYYVDVEVVRSGRALDAFGFFNSTNPPPADDVTAMTDAGVTRLEAAL